MTPKILQSLRLMGTLLIIKQGRGIKWGIIAVKISLQKVCTMRTKIKKLVNHKEVPETWGVEHTTTRTKFRIE
jgi:hypothetical protein